jgi:hypothetical protein
METAHLGLNSAQSRDIGVYTHIAGPGKSTETIVIDLKAPQLSPWSAKNLADDHGNFSVALY